MYVPEHFAMTPEQVAELISDRGVGDLITCGSAGLQATFLPFHFDPTVGEHGVLRTHVSKVNPQWRDEGPALVIFHGADRYISPTWIPDAVDRNLVPTWNYLTVQVHGQLVSHHDEEWKLDRLRELVDMHEDKWDLSKVSSDHFRRFLPAMVGVEIQISAIVGKAKMNQNRTPGDIEHIVGSLAQEGHGDEVGEFMSDFSLPHAVARHEEISRLRRQSQS